ncbi:MAG: hypothetical protein PHP42_09540 [Bacteroidota bacterium]|nr:hypothetical protein [Bacteroidota bacterium]
METSNIRVTQSGEIFLYLPNQKPKKIGWFNENGDTFHTQRNPAKHFHRNSNSYGFNYELLRDGNFSRVVVHLPFGEHLETSREHILENGFFLYFKEQGFEKQRFLALSEFGKEKSEEREKRLREREAKDNQQTLFSQVA